MRARTLIACSLILALSGCATSARTTVDYFYVIAEPAGAQVSTSLGNSCAAPCTLILPRRSSFDVTISHPGYAPWTGRITHVAHRGGSARSGAAAAGGAVVGASAGFLAADATNNVGLTLSGGPGVTNAGADMIAAGALIGLAAPLALDAASGANRNLSPNPLIVQLTPLAAAP